MAGRHRREPNRSLPPGVRHVLAAASVTTAVLMTATALVAPTRDTPTIDALPLPEPATVERTFWPAPRITTPPPETEVVPAETTAASPTAEEPPPPPPEPEPEPEPPEPEPPPPPPPPVSCPTELKGTRPHVAQVGNHIARRFEVGTILGLGNRGRSTSDHPRGLALDFMVGRAKGDQIADYLLANQGRFSVRYVIWRQRYNDGSGWDPMEDRGGATANHMDHVHASFNASGSVDVTC